MAKFSDIKQKKGQVGKLCGRLIVYISLEENALENDQSGFKDMVRGNMLVVRGDYRNKQSFRQMLTGSDNSEDADNMLRSLQESGDLPEGMDISSLFDKLEDIGHMEIIPVPAQIALYESEEEMLKEDADIFYLGKYKSLNHGHLSVTSFPILYQSWYQEQEYIEISSEIDSLLSEVETKHIAQGISPDQATSLELSGHWKDPENGELEKLFLTQVIPALLHDYRDHIGFQKSVRIFKDFLADYPFPEDVERILELIPALDRNEAIPEKEVELLCRKIAALHHENFKEIQSIQQELQDLSGLS